MTSNYSAGVPIKKRRFPLIRPPSPPAEEQSVINYSLQSENSSPSERSTLSNAGLSDAIKESLLAERKGNPDVTNVKTINSSSKNYSVKVEQPSHTIHSVSRTDVDSKEKLVGAEKSADAIKSVKVELNLAPIEAPALTIGTDLSNKQKKVENSTQELVKTPCMTELSLAVKEPVVSAIEGHNGERSHQNCKSGGPVSLNLSLISGNSNQCKGDNVDLNTNSDMHANRSNWDLNTTMDAWNGSVVDEASGQGTVDGCNTIGGTHDVKPSICSVGIFGDRVTSKGQNFEKSKCRSAGALSSHLLGQRCNSEDNLHLGLSPSFSLSNLSQKPSSSSAILNSSWGIANSGLGKAFELTGTVNQINIGNVKSEPLDESIKHGFTGATAIPKGLPDIRAVKRELVERFNAEALKSFNLSAPKLVDCRSIKSEPVREDIQETVKKMEGTLNQSDKQMVEAMDNRGKTTSSAALSTSGEVPNSFEHSSNTKEYRLSREVPQEKPESSGQVLSETMSTPVGLDGNASNLIMEVPHETSLSREVPHETNLSGEVPHETNLSREVPHETNLSREVPHDNNLSREVPQEKSESAGQVLIETVSVGHDGNLLNVSSLVDTAITDKNIDDTERCRLKFMEEVPPNSRENGEGSASDDEEKINLSGDMLEEDSYDFDSESDASHNLETAMDAEHNNGKEEDFEDGEVRESLVHTELEGHICEKRELQHFNSGDSSDNKQLDFVGLPSEHPSTSSSTEDEPTKTVEPSETNNDSINKFGETAHDENNNKGAGNKDCILQKPLAGGMPAIDGDQKRCSTTSPIRSVVMSKRKDGLNAQETEQSYYQATSASQGNSAAIAQGLDENVKNTNVLEESVSPLPKAEASLTIDYAAKDADNGGNKSRIINLPRASNMPSPGQTRTISGSSLPSRAGREKLTDVELEEIYPRGSDEIYTDASHKFSRERHQDHQSRNSRFNFVRGRGRISSRIDSVHGDWNSEREFAREFYGPTEFHVPRHKYASQPDSDFNGYNVGLNGDFVSIGRGGRKIFNDEASVFPHLPRRRSPGGRVGPRGRGRGLDMVRRVPRHISLSGCIGEDGTELVGPRRGEKFIRGIPNDNTDPIYTHPQGPYDGLDGHFVRSNRNFLPMQRRGIPHVRSKSPIDSRTRSPGTWSPARRRSPDRFGGHPELPNRRSPPIFRMERMRSPDHSCFPGEMVGRRHGSPYMSRPPNELRDMDSSHDLGHPRSAMPNRSPSGRILLRNTRRFDIVDPHERTDSDGYFGRPMHSGRFQELDADGTVEDRRRFGERRGPIRPFRPPYNGAEGENFHINAGDGPRPFRFCPEDGPEFHERGNLREREFDRRIKNRPGNGPRRSRNIEGQEGNYRHGGQVWHDNGFDDMSRIKRKKF